MVRTRATGRDGACNSDGRYVETEQTFDVFLSHAHVDSALVERLGARLVDEAQLSVPFVVT